VLQIGLCPELVLATPSWIDRHSQLIGQLPVGASLRAVTPEVLAAAASTRTPDGVLLVLPTPAPQPPAGEFRFVLALDRIQDPGNLGTLLRLALAAGVEQIWLGEGADPHQPKVLRASSGAALTMPLLRLEAGQLAVRLASARQKGLKVVAAVPPSSVGPEPQPYWELDWGEPIVLLLGNEGAGLAADLLEPGDALVTIPHSPAVESLNVAVAAAPLLLERWRQQAGGLAVSRATAG
jgi:TrmH family RNA methyltransferase